jgi:pyocin large subunit-like protein
MRSKALLSIAALIVAVAIAIFEARNDDAGSGSTSTQTNAHADTREEGPAAPTSTVGFSSKRALDEHFEKHGHEFGSRSAADYLALAQKLRDAPKGGAVVEAVRDDGVITRFDKQSGAFLAFNANKTIRTFFKPNDGLRYFERQLDKEH